MLKLLPLILLCCTPLALGQAAPSLSSAQPDAVLPPIPELLRDVERNQDAADVARKDYTYHLHEETKTLDSKGALKKTETRDAESFRVEGVLVNRTTARNGKPLTPNEQQKESDRIDKQVAKEKEHREKLQAAGKSTDDSGNEELTLSRILQLGTFSNERRADLNGRPTLVIDYAGDPNAKTKTRLETIFRDIVGTIWIDEQDRAIAQLQGHFVNDYKIGGGLLADVHKGSSFHAIFSRINNEVWLPRDLGGEGKVRVLLFVSFNGKYSLTASDYKKFRTTTTLIPTNRVVDENGQPIAPPTQKQ